MYPLPDQVPLLVPRRESSPMRAPGQPTRIWAVSSERQVVAGGERVISASNQLSMGGVVGLKATNSALGNVRLIYHPKISELIQRASRVYPLR